MTEKGTFTASEVSRARSALQTMTHRQLERTAEKHGFAFDLGVRGKLSKKQMIAQLMNCEDVIRDLGVLAVSA